jgi:alpha-tubulin suppressor-like RCC1 family protein
MKSVFAPLQTPIVADIQTGVFHTIILTDTGDCYSGGDVESYKLGYSSGEFSGFRRVDTLIHPVKLIRAIDNMSVFVTVYDEIFVCGRSSQGLLGLPNTVNMLTKITLYNARGKIDFNPPIVDIQLGQYHSFVIGEDNQVYGHGNNDNRNLLNNDIGQNSVMKLTNVEGFLDSTGVTLGRRIGLACGDKYTIVYFTENDRAVERHFMKLNLIRHMDQLVDIEIVTHH